MAALNNSPRTAQAIVDLVMEEAARRVSQIGEPSRVLTNRPKIVCLCGSTRFIDQLAILAWELEKQGVIALGLHLLPASYKGVERDHQAEVEGVRERMDELHLRKIDLADEILVANVGGYVGSSTRNEVKYARLSGKPVRWLEPHEVPEELR